MIKGCPENRANNIPISAVETRVSDTPIRLFVFAPGRNYKNRM
jgi:hypothetical protein